MSLSLSPPILNLWLQDNPGNIIQWRADEGGLLSATLRWSPTMIIHFSRNLSVYSVWTMSPRGAWKVAKQPGPNCDYLQQIEDALNKNGQAGEPGQ